jgi:broad specificity phosphatase PhoE
MSRLGHAELQGATTEFRASAVLSGRGGIPLASAAPPSVLGCATACSGQRGSSTGSYARAWELCQRGPTLKMTTRLILVRHAQTASNGGDPDPRLSGWTDLPLSPAGREQVGKLQRHFHHQPPADALYSSPLERARDTAWAIVHASRTPVRLLDDLREIGCGDVDGMHVSEVKRLWPELWEENLRQENEHFRWPGGESYLEFRERSLNTVRSIVSAHPGERVIVVTHAGVISQVLGTLHKLSSACWARFRPENASLTELEWTRLEDVPRLISFNAHSHLMGLAHPGIAKLIPGGCRCGLVRR